MIQAIRPEDTGDVLEIRARCHPEQPWPPTGQFFVYPTLVERLGEVVVGFTSFSVSPGLAGVPTLYGNDLCVLPAWRQQGIGWALACARVEYGRRVGARLFIGLTRESNHAMVAIFKRQGLHACQTVRGYFGTEDGVAWVGEL